MGNLLQRLRYFIVSPTHSRTLTVLALLIVVAAVPLTVFIAQKQQDVRQRASSSAYPCSASMIGVQRPGTCDLNGLKCSSWSQYIYSDENGQAWCDDNACGEPCEPPPCNSDSSCNQDQFCYNSQCTNCSQGYLNCDNNLGCETQGSTCPSPKCTQDSDCESGRTCVGSSGSNSSGTFCIPNNVGINGSYCGKPDGTPNNLACESSYCNPSSLTCAVNSGGGETVCKPGIDWQLDRCTGDCTECVQGEGGKTFAKLCKADGSGYETIAVDVGCSTDCASSCTAQPDIKIGDGCPPKECDPNLKKFVCIETWKRPNGSTYTKPGTLTNETCGTVPPPIKSSPSPTSAIKPSPTTATGDVALSGKVIDLSTNQGIPNIVINQGQDQGCYIGTAKTDANGNFSYPNIANGKIFCMRGPQIQGYTGPNTAYECQKAGGLFDPDACNNIHNGVTGTTLDVGADNGYNFTYDSGNGTKLSPNLVLSFIGNGRGNGNPVHKEKNLTVCVYAKDIDATGDSNCSKGIKKEGKISYDSSTGNYINDNFDFGALKNSGQYQIFLKTDKYLRKRIPTIVSLTLGQKNIVPLATLNIGDINGDNAIDIADYSAYLDCFGDKANSSSCKFKENADLNDDGKNDTLTDVSDFRLVFEAFKNQNGD
ncbi:hypothetical protein C4559_05385 [Candidatus Microgenomates bacterium]|nr:MAG: hypothetical protein C4559_05385 [Candidatus Microgenomates bacterium]